MAVLDSNTRDKVLGKVITDARREAEHGARRALEALAVGDREPHPTMSPAQRRLRVRLRSHGRQLGDARDPAKGTQSTARLAHEVAYEHWHRMLFARFLAENHLLIEPASGVAISMEECRDLARNQGKDPWVLAARFAQRMLPEIFRQGDPSLDVNLPRETCVALEGFLESLPHHVFMSDDALGWTYQLWQAEKKEEVNRSGVKIGADELPAVTQLFTENYMVRFLLDNTIGAWHAGKVLAANPDLAATAASEEELRRAVRLTSGEGYEFEFLRFVRVPQEGDQDGAPSGPWRPAAGTFPGWPKHAKELRVMDPCCGSGHFLVEALHLLTALRMQEERLPLEQALTAVLADNLHGLEIDARCTQLAAFGLAFAAWRRTGSPIDLGRLNIACSGLAPNTKKEEWMSLVGNDERLRGGMASLYDLFEQAPTLGSLINPKVVGTKLLEANFAELRPHLSAMLKREQSNSEHNERAVAAQGMARAAELLSARFTLVITNVPYLGRTKQSEGLRRYLATEYKMAKADLATAFVQRAIGWCAGEGTAALVTPHNWLFLTTYTKLRESLLGNRRWDGVARLGPGAFETIGGHVVNVALVTLTESKAKPRHRFMGLDVSDARRSLAKAEALKEGTPLGFVSQEDQLKNPDATIMLTSGVQKSLLAAYADAIQGMGTGDLPRWKHLFWEIEHRGTRWDWFLTTPAKSGFEGLTSVIDWNEGNGPLAGVGTARKGLSIVGRRGIGVAVTGKLDWCHFLGSRFDCTVGVVVPKDEEHLAAVAAFVQSKEFPEAVRAVDQALSVTEANFLKVPFDLQRWQKEAAKTLPTVLPDPESINPTQWIFHGHPKHSSSPLQVAVARLLGYRWPAESEDTMELSPPARSWVQQCKELLPLADGDGIVPLDALRGEDSAAERLRGLLVTAYGSTWSAAKERKLLDACESEGISLDDWLRTEFFEQHCKLFHHRPFIWHIWDGCKDGFNALVNYHKLAGPEGRRTLEALTYGYVGDWIERQRQQQREGVEGSDARLAAVQDLQAQLKKILEGEPPHDIFVRWKPLHEQPIGWEPDINDGVRINIRPFMMAELRNGGRKGAGILRWKPNIKWGKDRGTEPHRPKHLFPWFWGLPPEASQSQRPDFMGGSEFDGNRWNNLHYSHAVKQDARERHASQGENA